MTPDEIADQFRALELREHDVVVEAVLVAKVKDFETGSSGISMSATDGVEWVCQLGMLRAAEIITAQGIGHGD